MSLRYKIILKQIGLIAIIISIGTIIDWFFHNLKPEYFVPTEYFTNKIIFGTLIGFVVFVVFKRYFKFKTPIAYAIGVSLIVAISLQTRYFLQGYSLEFVFEFMIYHFLMFLLPSIFIFRKYQSTLFNN